MGKPKVEGLVMTAITMDHVKDKDSFLSLFSPKQMGVATTGLFFIFSLFCLIALFGPFLMPYSPSEVFTQQILTPPFWQTGGSMAHILGTDDLGRDMLTRLVYGARVSMGVGLLAVFIALTIGGALGFLSSYIGGRVDQFIMRVTDILMSLPSILLAIIVVTILGSGLMPGVIAVSILSMPAMIRLVRITVWDEKEKLYIMANKSLGSQHKTVIKNILMNCKGPILIQCMLTFSEAILNIAALGFLGLGAQPPQSEWGTMLADSKDFIETAPWLLYFPGICILLVVLSFNLLGDYLRDKLDPKLL